MSTSESVSSRQPSSTPSSKPSSVKSHDAPSKPPAAAAVTPDRAAAPAAGTTTNGASPAKEKASMRDRITRMLSGKEIPRASSAASSADAEAGTRPGGVTSNGASAPMSRKESTSDQGKPAKPQANKQPNKQPAQRFAANPDVQGGHEHHLKSSRRQEKLTDMFRALIGRKHDAPDHDLSLVSNWVDALRQEKDVAKDRKGGGGPSTLPTLVEKYGKCQEVVGRGAFGVVRISHKKSEHGEMLYAVKEFRRRPDETERKYSKRLNSEFCISSALRHPNVIHTLDLVQDGKGDYCEVMEYCAGGDLYTLVLSSGKLEVQEADCFFKQMMRGVQYLHEMGVAHRDLKPENLLLTTHGALKITDFGNGECFRTAWEVNAHMVSGLCGSAPYISPEEYTEKEFDARAVDVWACGVIYMAMRTGRHLWRVARKDEDEFYARYLEGRRDEEGYGPIESLTRVSEMQGAHISTQVVLTAEKARCRNVIYSILDPHPTRRLTAGQVLKSEWVREIALCKAGEEGL